MKKVIGILLICGVLIALLVTLSGRPTSIFPHASLRLPGNMTNQPDQLSFGGNSDKITFKLDLGESINSQKHTFIPKAMADETPDGKWSDGTTSIQANIYPTLEKNTSSPVTASVIPEKDGEFSIDLNRTDSMPFRPGKYTLKIDIASNGSTKTLSQDFSWGVLAINTNKSMYTPGEKAYLQFGVLDDKGNTICDAALSLKITTPGNHTETLSTGDKSIEHGPECSGNSYTTTPDYFGYYAIPQQTGTYTMELTAQTKNGVRVTSDTFEVKNAVDFDVERIGPTRIFPLKPYTFSLKITANKDFTGSIQESVPASFEVSPSDKSSAFTVETKKAIKELAWVVSLNKGEQTTLSYTIDFPKLSPVFYVVGPLQFFATSNTSQPVFTEARYWQIASDSVITGSHKAGVSSATDASSYTTTASWTPTAGQLVIVAVENALSGTPTTPTLSGNGLTWGTPIKSYLYDSSGTQFRLSIFAALTGGSPSNGTVTADFGGVTQLAGSISVEEFDGADVSGTAADAIIQSVSGTANLSGTSESITLAALSDSSNASFGFFGHEANEATVQGSGYTLLNSDSHGSGPSSGIGTEYKVPGSTTVDASWTTSVGKGGIALEIKAGTAAPGVHTPLQGNWRWYLDDATDTSMTAMAGENTAPTLTGAQMLNYTLRMRVQIAETNATAGSGTIDVQYSEDGGSNWQTIEGQTPATNMQGVWFRYANGAATASNTIGSQLLTGTTESGKYHEASGVSESVGASAVHELDVAVYVHWPPPDSTIKFRLVYGGTALALNTGKSYPQITTSTAGDRGNVTITRLDADGSQKSSREMRFASWPRFFYDGTRWWFFTVFTSTPQIIRSFSWEGTGSWTARDTIDMGATSDQSRHAFAFKVISGTPTVIVHAGDSSTSRKVVKGTISGTTITWGAVQTITQNSDRHRHVAFDDGNFIWLGGITAGSGVWAVRSTSANDVTAWNTALTASDTGVVSGDILTIIGLSSNKALFIWRSGTVLKYATVTSSGFGTVGTVNSTTNAGPEDWGVTRADGYVYVVHSDSTGSGGNWKLRVFNESNDTWSDGTDPGVSGQPSTNDGIAVTSYGSNIYAVGTFGDPEGGQDRKLRYAVYNGPGPNGTWRTIADMPTTTGSRGNGDHVDTGNIQGGGKVLFGFNFNDDEIDTFARTAEYHWIDVAGGVRVGNGTKLNSGVNLKGN